MASSEQVFAAIDRYAEHEHFVLMRDDREAGRFLARRSEKDTVVERERVVMMAMAITQLDSVRCVIDARFSFANERGNSSQHDQQVLNRYFDLLFDFLDSQYREYLLPQ